MEERQGIAPPGIIHQGWRGLGHATKDIRPANTAFLAPSRASYLAQGHLDLLGLRRAPGHSTRFTASPRGWALAGLLFVALKSRVTAGTAQPCCSANVHRAMPVGAGGEGCPTWFSPGITLLQMRWAQQIIFFCRDRYFSKGWYKLYRQSSFYAPINGTWTRQICWCSLSLQGQISRLPLASASLQFRLCP